MVVKEADDKVPDYVLCLCQRIPKVHCESFADKIWKGCKKLVKKENEDGS